MAAPDPFEGRLTRLRAREPEDEPLYHAWLNDPEVTEHLTLRYLRALAEEGELVRATGVSAHAAAGFTILRKDTGAAIGLADLHHGSPEHRKAELRIAIGDKSCWDGGYGTDATRTLCRFGFEMMNLHRIELTVFPSNERARHIYEKLGFREEARLRDGLFKFGHHQDVIVMGLLHDELQQETR